MSAIRITLAFILLSFSCLNAQTASETLDTLITHKSYFQAKRFYTEHLRTLGTADSLFYGAILDNAFNKPDASLNKIALLSKSGRMDSDHARYLLEIQHADYARTGRYEEAAKCLSILLKNYGSELSKEDKDDYNNSKKIWSTLKSVPPQTVTISADVNLEMTKDKAGLWTIPVSLSNTGEHFIFDTGANISTVPRSTAERMKMKIYKAGIDVNSITGEIVKADLAVCPEFSIGSIVVRNAIFLVFPDKALTIDQIDYKIEGILGFPVIEAFGEITVSKDGVLQIPQHVSGNETPNLALDFLTPVAELGNEYFTFDSGATNTILYPKWFEAHKETVLAESELEEKLKYGGAGGAIERPGYYILWKPELDGKLLELKDVMVFQTPLTENEKWFWGNIGQDVIRSFHSYTINFRSMKLSFN